MDKLHIQGGVQLKGEIKISGSKNAALPLMVAALLTSEKLILDNIPDLADIRTIAKLLEHLGLTLTKKNNFDACRYELCAASVNDLTAPYDLVRKMRASVLVLGPLLTRFGKARVSLPGGCAIGTRPIDLHLYGLRLLGAKVDLDDGYINAFAPSGLIGNLIAMPKISVGATENIMMAATLAHGETIIENAAQEPEIADLARCLIKMGARIKGAGTGRIVINGVKKLRKANHKVIPDRIEAGTYAVAAAITGGAIKLVGFSDDNLTAFWEVLKKSGVSVTKLNKSILIESDKKQLLATDVSTQPYPGFPTDMQAQIMSLLSMAVGTSKITENIFENRYMHIPELVRMGADIFQQGSTAVVRGVPKLQGAQVMATDLRASVSLVLAGLAAEGETLINRIYHLDRGYEKLVEKLASCGALIKRIN
tara:strand:+ start:879 stop:2147 length:1269 start_codon:yes stop_codon:yes gene_type:complete